MNQTQARIAHLDLVPLIEKYAPGLSGDEETMHGLCPFPGHNDNSPSFGIYVGQGPDNGCWVCSCGRGMFPQFIMNILDISFPRAMDVITKGEASHTGIANYLMAFGREDNKKLEHEYKKIALKNIPEKVVDYLNRMRYYKGEDGNDVFYENPSVIQEEFKITISVDPICNSWIIIPIFSEDGTQVISWIGQEPNGRGKYHGGKMRGALFNLSRISSRDWVIVVESVWCAIRLWSYGFPAVCTFGARLDQWQAKLLQKYFTTIYLCYDVGEAGERAAKKAASLLSPQCKVFDMRVGRDSRMDPDKSTYAEIQNAIDGAIRI